MMIKILQTVSPSFDHLGVKMKIERGVFKGGREGELTVCGPNESPDPRPHTLDNIRESRNVLKSNLAVSENRLKPPPLPPLLVKIYRPAISSFSPKA